MSAGRSQHKRCCVGCKDPIGSLHRLPAAEELREKWLDFIYDGKVPPVVGKHLCVCADHFTPDCFINFGQYSLGMARKLLLVDGAVPTVRAKSNDEENVSQRYNEQRPTATTRSEQVTSSLPLRDLAAQNQNLSGPQSELFISSPPLTSLAQQNLNVSGPQSELFISSLPLSNLAAQNQNLSGPQSGLILSSLHLSHLAAQNQNLSGPRSDLFIPGLPLSNLASQNLNISGPQSELFISSLHLNNLAPQNQNILGLTNQGNPLELDGAIREVACQTEPQKGCSVGTQLTKTTLQPRFRSKSTQSSVPRKDVCVGTSTAMKRPLKRPRLEECRPLTCDAAEPLTDPSVSTEETSEASGPVNNTTFTICEKNLVEIFKECPVCQAVCDVQQRRMGIFLSVDQRCQNCGFERQWSSHPNVGGSPAEDLHLSSAVKVTIKTEEVFEDCSSISEGGEVDPQPHP